MAVLVVAAVGLGLELGLIGCVTWLAEAASGCASELSVVPAAGLADGCGLASGVGEALLGLAVLLGVAWVAAVVRVPPPTEPLDELGVAAAAVSELLGVALLPAA